MFTLVDNKRQGHWKNGLAIVLIIIVLYVLSVLFNMPHIWSSMDFFCGKNEKNLIGIFWRKLLQISIWDPTILRKIKACNFKSLQHKLQCQERAGFTLNHFFIHLWVRITTQMCAENPLILSFSTIMSAENLTIWKNQNIYFASEIVYNSLL